MCTSIIPGQHDDVENLNVVPSEPIEFVDLDQSKSPITKSRHIIFEQNKRVLFLIFSFDVCP